jgi:hypothetical protein
MKGQIAYKLDGLCALEKEMIIVLESEIRGVTKDRLKQYIKNCIKGQPAAYNAIVKMLPTNSKVVCKGQRRRY